MKLSCLPVSLFGAIQSGKMTIEQWGEAAKAIGFDGYDISMLMLTGHTQTYIDSVRRQISRVGLPVAMATTYPDFTHPDKKQRDRELAYLMGDIALCEELGVEYLRVLAGQKHEGVCEEDGVRFAIDYLHRADKLAHNYNIKLVFENHAKPGAWDNVDFSYPIDIFYKVFDGLRDTDIKLNFDVGNVVAQDKDPMKVLEREIDRVETVHISDMEQYGVFNPTVIGTGVCPIKAVIDRLREAKFNGWVSIEEASGTGLDGIQKAFDYVNGIINGQ